MTGSNIEDIDLLEASRRDYNYEKVNEVIDSLKQIDVFPSLVWVWCWDMIRSWYEDEQWDDVHEDPYVSECFSQDVDLKDIWDKFWYDSDKNGFSLEFGVDQLDEQLRDWLRECDFLVSLDDDGWLDDKPGDN